MYGIQYYWKLLFATLHVHTHKGCIKAARRENGYKTFYRIGPVIYWPVIACRWFVIGELYHDNRKDK